jgi:hypothetical protein
VPTIAGSWEREGETAFLLEPAEATTLPPSVDEAGFQIRFEDNDGHVWAIGSGGEAGKFRRGIFAFADGLLVPIGTDDQDAGLHLRCSDHQSPSRDPNQRASSRRWCWPRGPAAAQRT